MKEEKKMIKIEPTKVDTESNGTVTAYFYDFEVISIVGCQGSDITNTGSVKGYNPETMTDNDCYELAKTLHTIENRGAQHPLKTAWTQEVMVAKNYYDENGELIGWEIPAYSSYEANGYDGRD